MAVMLPDKWSQLKLPSIGKADPAEQERLLKLLPPGSPHAADIQAALQEAERLAQPGSSGPGSAASSPP